MGKLSLWDTKYVFLAQTLNSKVISSFDVEGHQVALGESKCVGSNEDSVYYVRATCREG